jgi:F-type H+-transporting ATPase subunit delta
VLAELTNGSDPLVGRSLAVLHANGRLRLLADVAQAYARRYADEHDELDVVLTTAIAISDEKSEALRARLAEATGKTVRLERKIDPQILGGIVLRVRDMLVDASIRRRLELLRLDLMSSRSL